MRRFFAMAPSERSGALALTLAAGLAVTVSLPSAPPPEAAPGGRRPAAASLMPGAFLDRAPFDPERRRAAAAGALPALSPAEAPGATPLVLSGIFFAGGERRAMFAAAPGEWLREGAVFAGWTLREIRRSEVVLEQNGERRLLSYGDALANAGP